LILIHKWNFCHIKQCIQKNKAASRSFVRNKLGLGRRGSGILPF
jgi:hypothetical protein